MNDFPFALTRLPYHVGIIMDGNGRWAARRGLPRAAGHQAGAKTVRRITEASARLGIRQLTLYAFSSENWSRPGAEVDLLMRLFAEHLRAERKTLIANDIRLRVLGRLHELSEPLQRAIQETANATARGAKMTLALAINYGGRNEIVDACRRIAERVACGEIAADAIDDDLLWTHLYQPEMPPLDLVIRTAGEMRLSNFLLWQAAYAEFWSTPVLWPDFEAGHLAQALAAFAARERRFGGLTASPAPATACAEGA